MRRMVSLALATVAATALLATTAGVVVAADVPADRVVAMYFHRTQRCPTCLKMGSLSEEAVKTGFTPQIKKGKVAFYYIDFQNPKNAAYTKGYKITGPTLIVAKIHGSKVLEYKATAGNMDEGPRQEQEGVP